MKITQEQWREAAQMLYPQIWREDRITALIDTLKILHEASFEVETRPVRGALPKFKKAQAQRPRPVQEIVDLEEHLKANKIHISAAANAIGVNAVTLYSWFNHQSRPKPENITKIRSFLSKTKA